MDTTKAILDLVPVLASGAQARVCKLILQELLAGVTEDGPCELWLQSRPVNGIGAIKAVRAITGLGLKEAKDIFDAASVSPRLVRKFDTKREATDYAKELTAVGAEYSIREAK